MKRFIPLLIITLISLLITSCASTKKLDNYAKNKEIEFKRTAIIKDTVDNTWKRTLVAMARNNFFIENSEREAGLINISFSEIDPTQYITCGVLTVKDRTLIRTSTLEYDLASSFKFQKGFKPNGEKTSVVNTAHLSGKGNILFTKHSSGGTRVRVHIFYTLLTEVKYKTVDTTTDVINQTYPLTTSNDLESTEEIYGNDITCRTKGTLETKLLTFAKTKEQLATEAIEEDSY